MDPDPKQFNVPMRLFAHREFAELQRALRDLGSKPTKGDLVAALIHAALGDVEAAKFSVEEFVRHELAEAGNEPPTEASEVVEDDPPE